MKIWIAGSSGCFCFGGEHWLPDVFATFEDGVAERDTDDIFAEFASQLDRYKTLSDLELACVLASLLSQPHLGQCGQPMLPSIRRWRRKSATESCVLTRSRSIGCNRCVRCHLWTCRLRNLRRSCNCLMADRFALWFIFSVADGAKEIFSHLQSVSRPGGPEFLMNLVTGHGGHHWVRQPCPALSALTVMVWTTEPWASPFDYNQKIWFLSLRNQKI